MGLFDDILKKPANQGDPLGGMGGTQSSGQGGTTTDPSFSAPQALVIEKSEAETVFGPGKEEVAPPEVPQAAAPTAHAESDASSILMPSMPTPVADTPVVMIAPSPVTGTFINQASTPTPEVIMPTPAPVASLLSLGEQSTPTIEIVTPVTHPENKSLLESVMGGSPEPDMLSLAATEPEIPVPAVVAEEAPKEEKENFATPRDFIERSLASIATMMQNIEVRHNSKITEAEGYKAEKLRFTDLEKTAYAEASIMDKERDHAIHMKKILEAELARDEANRNGKELGANHVESTLSEIGNEHPIGAHKHAHKKHDAHDTEPALMAS